MLLRQREFCRLISAWKCNSFDKTVAAAGNMAKPLAVEAGPLRLRMLP
jgi:hypothetical protein